jgi:hypothetical protein
MRGAARHLHLAVRLAEATQKTRWIAWRDKLLDCWLMAPDWDTRGMYFNPAKTASELGSTAWDSGARLQSTFQIGVLTEAFAQAWRTTGRPEIKAKMVAMAEFIYRYGLDSAYQYTGSNFGIVDGRAWHNYFSKGTPTFADPVYTTSLVNTLVWGYIHTGERRYYDRAVTHFNRGTKGIYGSFTVRTAPDTVAHHFVDTRFSASTSNIYLAYNKGELQYTYMLFDPGVVSRIEKARPAASAFSLTAFPNPFSGSVDIRWKGGKVSVYDLRGRLVQRIRPAADVNGTRTASWRPIGLPSGIYIFKVSVGKASRHLKVLFQK